jgi:hypothetical protein
MSVKFIEKATKDEPWWLHRFQRRRQVLAVEIAIDIEHTAGCPGRNLSLSAENFLSKIISGNIASATEEKLNISHVPTFRREQRVRGQVYDFGHMLPPSCGSPAPYI